MICIRSLHIFRTLDQFKHYMYMLKQIIVMGMPRQKNEILIDAEKSENMRRMIVMCDKPSNRMNVDRCEISGRTASESGCNYGYIICFYRSAQEFVRFTNDGPKNTHGILRQ